MVIDTRSRRSVQNKESSRENESDEGLGQILAGSIGGFTPALDKDSGVREVDLSKYKNRKLVQSNKLAGRNVYEALDSNGKPVFIKEYFASSINPLREASQNFQAEVQITDDLSKRIPIVPKVIEWGRCGYSDVLVLEGKPGNSFKSIISEESRNLHEKEILGLTKQILDVFEVMHGLAVPIIHRDLKPSHVNLEKGVLSAYLDFGAGGNRDYGDNTLTRGISSDFFTAPEAIKGITPDKRTDYYSLGAVMFYLLAKKNPLEDNPARLFEREEVVDEYFKKRLKNVSKKTKKIIQKLMRELPENRYQELDNLREDIDKTLNYLEGRQESVFARGRKILKSLYNERQKARERKTEYTFESVIRGIDDSITDGISNGLFHYNVKKQINEMDVSQEASLPGKLLKEDYLKNENVYSSKIERIVEWEKTIWENSKLRGTKKMKKGLATLIIAGSLVLAGSLQTGKNYLDDHIEKSDRTRIEQVVKYSASEVDQFSKPKIIQIGGERYASFQDKDGKPYFVPYDKITTVFQKGSTTPSYKFDENYILRINDSYNLEKPTSADPRSTDPTESKKYYDYESPTRYLKDGQYKPLDPGALGPSK